MNKLRKGTSIIEAVISIALVGIILLWSTTAYENISKQSKDSESIEIASILASNQIEYVKTLNLSGLQSISNSSSVVSFSSPYSDYGYKYINVTATENSSYYLKDITVNVYKMNDQSVPLIEMKCNFLKNKSSGNNAGI